MLEYFSAEYADLESASRAASAVPKAVVFANLVGGPTHFPADEYVVLVPRSSALLLDQGRALFAIFGSRLQHFTGSYTHWELVDRSLTATPEKAASVAQAVAKTPQQAALEKLSARWLLENPQP